MEVTPVTQGPITPSGLNVPLNTNQGISMYWCTAVVCNQNILLLDGLSYWTDHRGGLALPESCQGYCWSRYDAEITQNWWWRQCITEDLPDASRMYDWNIHTHTHKNMSILEDALLRNRALKCCWTLTWTLDSFLAFVFNKLWYTRVANNLMPRVAKVGLPDSSKPIISSTCEDDVN